MTNDERKILVEKFLVKSMIAIDGMSEIVYAMEDGMNHYGEGQIFTMWCKLCDDLRGLSNVVQTFDSTSTDADLTNFDNMREKCIAQAENLLAIMKERLA